MGVGMYASIYPTQLSTHPSHAFLSSMLFLTVECPGVSQLMEPFPAAAKSSISWETAGRSSALAAGKGSAAVLSATDKDWGNGERLRVSPSQSLSLTPAATHSNSPCTVDRACFFHCDIPSELPKVACSVEVALKVNAIVSYFSSYPQRYLVPKAQT